MQLTVTIPPGKHDKGAKVILGTKQRAYLSCVPVTVRNRNVLTHGKQTYAPGVLFGHYRADVGVAGRISWVSLN